MLLKLASGKIQTRNAGIAGILIILLFLAASCNSGPPQSPEDFTKAFLEKHIKRIDMSAANFYIKDEQPGIKDLISRNIQAKKEEGTYDSLENATFDLSNIGVTVLDRNVTYVDDEPKIMVVLKATGVYTVTIDGRKKTDREEEVIVLQAIGGEWKVTEKVKPWTPREYRNK